MNINGLMSLLGQQWSKTTAEPAAAAQPSAAQPIAAGTMPAAIYHPSGADDVPATYESSVMEVWAFDEEAWQRDDAEMRELWWKGFATSLGEMRHGYEAAMSKLSPELAAKDWGFSIRNEALVIVPGRDALSDHEIAILQKALGDLELPGSLLAGDVVRYLELDRGTDGVSEGIGRFDVSRENFDQVIDLRELLLSHGDDAKYGRGYINKHDYRGMYSATGALAIFDQINERGEERFLATARQRDYQTRVY